MLDYDEIPVGYMREAVQRYIEQGIPPGGFLTAIICNNLKESFMRADENNARYLQEWVQWFYWQAPGSCWGSPEKMHAWIAARQAASALALSSPSEPPGGTDA